MNMIIPDQKKFVETSTFSKYMMPTKIPMINMGMPPIFVFAETRTIIAIMRISPSQAPDPKSNS